MKQFFLVVSVSLVAVAASGQKKKPGVKASADTDAKKTAAVPAYLKTSLDSFSYALGMNIGNNLKQQNITNVNTAAMLKAMDEIFKSKPTSLSDQRANMCIQTTLQSNVAKKATNEKAKAAKFLAENKKRAGVKTLPNGLQYEVIKSGDANSVMPQLQDTFVVHYAGTLIDGKEFDNSYKRGQPLSMPVGGVIRGWTEILQKMHIGDKWKVYIPSDLGYGDMGTPDGSIPGGAALIFEMELLDVKTAGVKQTEAPKSDSPQAEKAN